MPRRIVGRDKSVAAATSEMPPRPRAIASEAAQQRLAFSCSSGAKASYFWRTVDIIAGFAIMRLYSKCTFWQSYFGPPPLIVAKVHCPLDQCGREYRVRLRV